MGSRVSSTENLLIEVDDRASHQAGFVAGKKSDAAGDLVGLDEAAEGLLFSASSSHFGSGVVAHHDACSPGVSIQPMLRPLTRMRSRISA